MGRFISADTLVPSPSNPQDFNRYSYVRNNPLRFTDPTGHYTFEDEPDDQFFVPPQRYPQFNPTRQAMRKRDFRCMAQCRQSRIFEPETQASLQGGVGALCEVCDWGFTLNRWRQGDFSPWDLIGFAPIVSTGMVQAVINHASDMPSVALGLGTIDGDMMGYFNFYFHTIYKKFDNRVVQYSSIQDAGLTTITTRFPNWPDAFEEGMNNASHIHFNITGMDPERFLLNQGDWYAGANVTNTELFHILQNDVWLNKTTFYLNDKPITVDYVKETFKIVTPLNP